MTSQRNKEKLGTSVAQQEHCPKSLICRSEGDIELFYLLKAILTPSMDSLSNILTTPSKQLQEKIKTNGKL